MKFTGEGKIAVRRYKDKNTGQEKVAFDFQVFGGKFGLFVREELIPDIIENVLVGVSGEIRHGKKGLYLMFEKNWEI